MFYNRLCYENEQVISRRYHLADVTITHVGFRSNVPNYQRSINGTETIRPSPLQNGR